MQGHPRIIDLLNQVLRKELTGINQYFIRSRMCKNWGYGVLEKVHYDEAIEEMKPAALAVLPPGIALCLEIGDHGTRDLLARIVVDEEHHIDWIEAQRHKTAEVGHQQYLASRSTLDTAGRGAGLIPDEPEVSRFP
jgi:bacterioferritin